MDPSISNLPWTEVLTAIAASVTALATIILTGTAILGGIIASRQLKAFLDNERIKRTFTQIQAYVQPSSELGSPLSAFATLDRIPEDPEKAGVTGSRAELTQYVERVGTAFTTLQNYLDESNDLLERNLVDGDYFMSRQYKVILETVSLLRRFATTMSLRYDAELVGRIEARALDYEKRRGSNESSKSGEVINTTASPQPSRSSVLMFLRNNASVLSMVFTAVLAISTVVLVWGTFAYNARILSDQRQFNVATLRPYIAYTSEKLRINWTGLIGNLFYENVGKTPALDVHSAAKLVIFPSDSPLTIAQRVDSALVLLSGEPSEGTETLPPDVTQAVSAPVASRGSDLRILTDRARRLRGWVLVGETTYTDFFKGSHGTNICIYGNGDTQFVRCSEHNDAY